MIIFIKKKNKYLFYNKQKQILVVKDKPLFTFKKTHANLVLNQIASIKKKKPVRFNKSHIFFLCFKYR